jgi:hypothetical protein
MKDGVADPEIYLKPAFNDPHFHDVWMTYRPLVFVCPDSGASLFDILLCEESERCFGGYNFDFDVLVLGQTSSNGIQLAEMFQ